MLSVSPPRFYSLIPHNFGMKAPPPINTQDLLGAERALLQFYLRMGFEEIGGEDEEKLTPISGVMELPLPKTLLEGCKGICAPKEVNSCTKKGQALAVPELSWFFGVVSGELS
ncbi:unnamed protein product [Durusdinium trenchii]|uniref:PARP alpha-helical domain-containing protein n=1 Tax=Durusdinium trenchii TaxID=1381693 RepID=A0ABP0PMV0_9DINO